jgi:hypothetical protein
MLRGKRRVACLTLEPGSIEKSFSPKLTDYFIQGLRKQRVYRKTYIKGQTIQWPKENGQTVIYKTLHIKLMTEQHESHKSREK